MDGPVFDAMLKTALMEALDHDFSFSRFLLEQGRACTPDRPSGRLYVSGAGCAECGQIPGAMPGFWLMGRNLPTGNRPEGNGGRSVGCWWR